METSVAKGRWTAVGEADWQQNVKRDIDDKYVKMCTLKERSGYFLRFPS